jgi:hypothetical protein
LLTEFHKQPASLAERLLATMPDPLLRQMSDTDDVIRALATDFASRELGRMSPRIVSISGGPSPTEYTRFCRAFYRVDLFYTVFGTPGFQEAADHWFLRRLSPWENEQLGCVYDYLEAKFREGKSEDILS